MLQELGNQNPLVLEQFIDPSMAGCINEAFEKSHLVKASWVFTLSKILESCAEADEFSTGNNQLMRIGNYLISLYQQDGRGSCLTFSETVDKTGSFSFYYFLMVAFKNFVDVIDLTIKS